MQTQQTQTAAANRPATFEEACKNQGINPQDTPFITGTPQSIAFNRLSVIAAGIRQAPPLSFKDKSVRKYWAEHYYVAGVGFRFWFADDVFDCASAPGGSALCFYNREDAIYFGENFIPEFEPFYS